MDKRWFVIQLALSAVYLYIATGRVYLARGVGRMIKVALLIVATGCVVLGYRFFVFLVTPYST
jgi:hypothetical protein